MTTICLNMIVKDEAHVIERCLAAARPFITHWCIVDTGSSDGTQQKIRQALADLPGELHERPWRDFGHNRTEALQLAGQRAEYLLFLDADDVLEAAPGARMANLSAPAYGIPVVHGAIRYERTALVRSELPWRYVGVLHEYLDCGKPVPRTPLPGFTLRYTGEGARSRLGQREKFLRDAAVLERALESEPENVRYWFYLAQSWRDAGESEKALAAYERRASMGGWEEEVYCAQLQAARLARRLGRPEAELIGRYLLAWQTRPRRAEALGDLVVYLRERGNRWPLAFHFANVARCLPLPDDRLFVEPAWYQWRIRDEFAIAAYWVGQYATSHTECLALLQDPAVPAEQRPRILANANFARDKLGLPRLAA